MEFGGGMGGEEALALVEEDLGLVLTAHGGDGGVVGRGGFDSGVDEPGDGGGDVRWGCADPETSSGSFDDVGHGASGSGDKDGWAGGDVFVDFVGDDAGAGVAPFDAEEGVGLALDLDGFGMGDDAAEIEGGGVEVCEFGGAHPGGLVVSRDGEADIAALCAEDGEGGEDGEGVLEALVELTGVGKVGGIGGGEGSGVGYLGGGVVAVGGDGDGGAGACAEPVCEGLGDGGERVGAGEDFSFEHALSDGEGEEPGVGVVCGPEVSVVGDPDAGGACGAEGEGDAVGGVWAAG